MADLKISALTSATTPLAGTEVLPIVQSGTTKQVSVANLTAARDVTMQTANASQSVAAGVDLYTLQNINSTAVTTKYAGIRYRGRDTINSGKDSAYIRTYPVDADFNNSYLSFWTRTSDTVTEKVQISSAGNIVIVNSGNGIDFSATPGTGTSELLNDYEEGTWTPVIADALSGGNTGTCTIVNATYTKVGRQVTVQALITALNTTGMTAGNVFFVRGLPFTGSDYAQGNFYTYRVARNASTVSSSVGVSASTYVSFRLYTTSSATTDTYILVSDIVSGTSEIGFTVTYTV